MLKTFYVQTNEIDKVTDIIEFPHEDYKEVQLNTPLPSNVLSGSYKLMNGSLVYMQEWDIDKVELKNKISILEAENTTLKANIEATHQAIDFIVMNNGGM